MLKWQFLNLLIRQLWFHVKSDWQKKARIFTNAVSWLMIAKNSVKSKCESVNWKVNTFSRKNYILSVFCISVSFSGALAVLVTIQLLVALSLANLISRKDSPPTFLIWPLQSTWRNVLCLTDAPLVGQVCWYLEFDMIQWPKSERQWMCLENFTFLSHFCHHIDVHCATNGMVFSPYIYIKLMNF